MIFSQATFAYNCQNYALNAVKQGNAAQALFCGYTGSGWIATWQAHFDWCNSVPIDRALGEDNIRKYDLKTCIMKAYPNFKCSTYANHAVWQNNANHYLGCGFTGGGWQSNYAAHRNWCSSVADRSAPYYQDSDRKRLLIECIYR